MFFMSDLLVLTYRYPPENTTGSERVSSLVDYLANCEGEEIALVTLDYCQSNGNVELRDDYARVVRLRKFLCSKLL